MQLHIFFLECTAAETRKKHIFGSHGCFNSKVISIYFVCANELAHILHIWCIFRHFYIVLHAFAGFFAGFLICFLL